MKRIFFILLVLCTASFSFSQVQIGSDITGDAADDWFGFSVALSGSGNRVAAGAVFSDSNGEDAGYVKVYELFGGVWTKIGGNIIGEAAFDECGYDVALSRNGHRIAIGAHLNDGNGNQSGQVRVYEWINGSWTQLGNDIDGESFGDQFGRSVAMSSDGNRIVAGALYNLDAGLFAGHARIFEWDGTNWIQMGSDIDGEAMEDESGWSVDISSTGLRVAVSAKLNSGNGNSSGHVRIYEWDGSNWIQMGQDIDGENAGDFSGQSVSLSVDGSRIAIGAMRNADAGDDAGHIRVFEWTGSDWMQLGSDIDGQANDELIGRAIALSGNGNRLISEVWPDAIRIYNYINGEWEQSGNDLKGENTSEGFGTALSLSLNGSRLAVGSPFYNSDIGKVQVFEELATSFSDHQRKQLLCYPNPTNGLIHFQSFELEFGRIKIIDKNGAVRKIQYLNDQTLDLSYLEDGIYIISLNHENTIYNHRIVKYSDK